MRPALGSCLAFASQARQRQDLTPILRTHKVGVELLQKAFGHSSGRITLAYAFVQDDELNAMYMTDI